MLLVGVLFAQESRAEDYTRFSVPNGALAHLGKGRIGSGDRVVVYSPDSTRIAVVSDTGIWLYDTTTGAEVALLTGHGVSSVSFSPDGQTLASASREIRLWDVATRQEIATLEGHTHWVLSVSYSPDGTTLASGSSDGTILLWDMSPYITTQTPVTDFDNDGTVGFTDFPQFAAQFGSSRGDAGYDARFDLDGDGAVGFSDFLIFVGSFGQDA